ncbi:hypothetical protein [Shimia marina]|uniref:Type IV pilus biogenesis n=1 Tax=Shimia marina TaxID=321267 RepID=A0A0P1FDE0_9RHOB|nr:hypothetical protein [Shimia marina]CUH53298.1 hypothetical protein SHM7688_02751 [Shimia marina]SFD80433.1 hypothetical protein SAMN04488037_102520 [Shimia marina]
MTPDLALTLSFEGIRLLTRVQGGWHLLSEVALESDDLNAALAGLRQMAVDMSGEDFQTTVLLPNDQIKYLDLPTARMNEKKRRLAAQDALEASTPYKIDELVFDLSIQGGTPQVAAVARDTLQEAEAFAVEHDFNPVNFSAIPRPVDFGAAPDFGPTQAAEAQGLQIRHDPAVIEIIGEGPLPIVAAPEPANEAPAEAPQAQDGASEPPPAKEETPASDQDALLLTGDEVSAPPEEPEEKGTAEKAEGTTPDAPTAGPDKPDADAASAKPEAPAAFASIRAQKEAPAAARTGLSGVTRSGAADVSGTNAPSIPSDTARQNATALRFDPTKAVAGLTSEEPPATETLGKETQARSKDAEAPNKTALSTFSSARGKPASAAPAPRTTETAGDAEKKNLGKKAARKAAKANERQKLTTFGNRQSEVRGKPRYLGLTLMALLLVFLGGVALWASLFVEEGVSGLFSKPEDTEVAEVVPETAAEDETATLMATVPEGVSESEPAPAVAGNADETALSLVVTRPDGMTPDESGELGGVMLEPLAVESRAVEADTVVSGTDAITDSTEVELLLDAQAADDRLDPAEAEAQYAVTGIWQRAPEQPAGLADETSDDIYIASVDRDTIAFDAVALPTTGSLNTDALPRAQVNPVAADTVFDLDERGLVVAVPEGALSPEGVRVFAGRPPVVPASYPKRIVVDDSVLSPAATSRLASVRPKLRPSDLVENNQRATLGGRTLEELASIRPQLRPQSAQQDSAADQAPTRLAVKTSLRPRIKPSNIAQLASRATPSENVPSLSTSLTPAPATVTPSIPTTASVARQATIQNAINLKKTSLIGVYGTASNRRALVRLANGRYKKVQVGDRIDGGKVAAIGESELRYVKGGRNVTLKMPKDG